MKVAVTGASGQLGGAVLRRLIDDRTIKGITAVDLRPPAHVSGKLKWLKADVCDPKIVEHFQGLDAVFHLAFIVTKKTPRPRMEEVNVGGSKNVFRAAQAAKLKKIIYASSIAAYGVLPGHPVPLVEESPRRLQPDFPYGVDKFRVEAFLDDFEREVGPGVFITRFRPSVLIGTRMQNPLARLLGQIMQRGYFPGLNSPPVPLVWDEDVADAMILALKKDVRGAFNVSADEPATAAELAAAGGLKLVNLPDPALSLMDVLGPLLERLGIAEAADASWRKEALAPMHPSSERAKRELGWKPRCARSVDVVKRFVEMSPGAADPRILAIFRLTNLAGMSKRPFDEQQAKGIHARVYLNLTGKGGGDFGIIVDDDKVKIEFEIPRPPTSVATLPASLFLDMLAGRASFATAQLTGRVRIEGEPVATFLLGTMIARFRQLDAYTGMRGIATRAFTKWVARSPTQGGPS